MNLVFPILLALAMVVVAAGLSSPPPASCTKELMACPNGSAVGRNPARSCQFDACPAEPQCTAEMKVCTDGSVVGRDPEQGCSFASCPGLPECSQDSDCTLIHSIGDCCRITCPTVPVSTKAVQHIGKATGQMCARGFVCPAVLPPSKESCDSRYAAVCLNSSCTLQDRGPQPA